jgi:1-acyl-sn-glycerol-3-phosphate acyltransferase
VDNHNQRLLPINGSTARPAPYAGIRSEIFRWISIVYLNLFGWKISGDWPLPDEAGLHKAVLVAAPHTSNWDGINMLATAGYYRVKLRWMGKASLTHGPFGWVLKKLGCVAVDRSIRTNMVRLMAEAFEATDQMVLAVPPEGTRKSTGRWKSGFYHIAVAAKVPIVVSVLDYGTKRVSLAAMLYPTGDYKTDLEVIRGHYTQAVGKNQSLVQ